MSFAEKFNQTNPRYLEKLLRAHPSLTQREILVCMYLKLNYTNKEISDLMSISLVTIDTYRHNIRKKIGLNRKDKLITYLNTIHR